MLNDKQEQFCREYVVDLNATQAAIRAGYSHVTAAQIAAKLLTKVNIQEYIQALRNKISDKLEISAERVLREYAKLAFTNFNDLVDISTGSPVFRNEDDIEEEHLAALQSVSETKDGLKIKMHDKKGALDSLAKHLNLFREDNKKEVMMAVGKISKADAEMVKKVFDDIRE